MTGSSLSSSREATDTVPARREAAGGGAIVQAEFYGDPGRRVLTFTHLPQAPATAGVVICSSIGNEKIQLHRRELELATILAERGLASRRFHDRGAGDSDGDSFDLGFDSMLEDAQEAARQLRAETQVARVAFLGTRIGGLVAAAAAREHPGAPIALWEPVIDSARYFEEIFRYKVIQEVMQSRFHPAGTRRTLLQEIVQDGFADVLGFPLTRKLYEEAKARNLVDELTTAPRSLMLAQIRSDADLCADFSNLEQRVAAAGSSIDTRVFRERMAWWFLAKVYREGAEDWEVVASTADWLVAQLADS